MTICSEMDFSNEDNLVTKGFLVIDKFKKKMIKLLSLLENTNAFVKLISYYFSSIEITVNLIFCDLILSVLISSVLCIAVVKHIDKELNSNSAFS